MVIQHGPSVLGQGTVMFQTQVVLELGWYLVLNPMMSNMETRSAFGPWPNKQTLRDWYNGEKAEQPYSEEGPDTFNGGTKSYRKVFKKGSPLEWMNPLDELSDAAVNIEGWGQPEYHGHGVFEQVVSQREVNPSLRVSIS